MKIFENVNDYTNELKTNDIVVLGGKGYMDGIKSLESKHDTYKVVKLTERGLILKRYRGKTNLILHTQDFDQQIARLEKKEFNCLKILW